MIHSANKYSILPLKEGIHVRVTFRSESVTYVPAKFTITSIAAAVHSNKISSNAGSTVPMSMRTYRPHMVEFVEARNEFDDG